MIFRRKPRITRDQMLSAKPTRLTDVAPKQIDQHKWRLVVPLRPSRVASWFLRVPAGATKTFELDALGLFVWESCDGKTPVRQVIRKLAKRYNLNEREAEVATVTFLHTLAKKGLIGMAVKKK